MRPVSTLKSWIVQSGVKPRFIKAGMLKGVRMPLDLSSDTQILLGLYERELFPWLKHLSRGINTALDLGAGNGLFTLYFLKKTNAERVIAVEPLAERQTAFLDSLKLNQIEVSERLKLVPKFVNTFDEGGDISLDSLCALIQTPVLIKMDIETKEVAALKGATEVLKLSGVRWIIETHSRDLEAECIRILKTAGYKTIIISSAWWRMFIPELRPGGHNRWLAAWKDPSLEYGTFIN